MKYSKEHIQAVEERLAEYDKTIETGENCFGDCKVCSTVPRDALGFLDSPKCILYRCVFSTETTPARKYWDINEHTLKRIKARRDWIADRLKEALEEEC